MALVAEEESFIVEKVIDNTVDFPGPRKKVQYTYRKAQPISQKSSSRPSSRLHIKGITHTSRFRVYFGAVICLLFITSLVLSLLLPVYIFFKQDLDLASLIIPGILLISGILYFAVSAPCRCRVCRTPLFSFKRFLRNKKAHHLPLVGYTFSASLHVVLFRWFRCQACGTAQKLVKNDE